MGKRRWPKEAPVFRYGKYFVEAHGPAYSNELEDYGEPIGLYGRFAGPRHWHPGLWTLDTMREHGFEPMTVTARAMLALVKS